jgi:lipopolysaccharide export system permease protein
MRLLDRYLLRQLVAPFLFAVAALTSIMLLNQVARRFGQLVGKGLPWSVILEVFALCVPFIVAMTLPMAVLVAVLYAFTHLAADSEITAMRASGISVAQMLAPVFAAGLALGAANFGFTDQVLPRSNARLRTLLIDIQRKKPTFELREQVINDIPPSALFLRASRIEEATGRLREVTIYDLSQAQNRRIIYADSGRMGFAPDQTDLNLRLFHGSIHEFKNGDPAVFQLTHFAVNTIRVRDVSNQLERSGEAAVRGDREMSTCEMLGVVHDAELDARLALADRERLVRQDLYAILRLPPPTEVPDLRAAPLPAYCGWIDHVRWWLLPTPAAAQQPTQTRPRPPAGQAELGKLAAVEAAGAVRLSTWGQIMAAKDQAGDARQRAAGYEVEIHKKWAISAACLVFVLLGIPMALRFPRGGMGLVIGGGLSVFALYYVGLIGGEGLADHGILGPAVAMWTPNVVFTVAGLYGLHRVSRESGSARGGDLGEVLDAIKTRLRRRRAAA